MKFRIFTNHPDKAMGMIRASPESPAIITKPPNFQAPSLDWQPLDEEAHKCLVAYAERKHAAFVEGMTSAEREKFPSKAKFVAERVRPLPKAEQVKAIEAEAEARKDDDDDFEPLTLKEFAGGKAPAKK
jgi:hypothetical protein